MAEKEVYIINVKGQLVEVSPTVYNVYFQMKRQERGQEEKKQRNGVFSYDALDNESFTGKESIPDLSTPSLEDLVIVQELRKNLRCAVNSLPRSEQELIKAIYFECISERAYAKRKGISQMSVNKQHRKILSKIRMFYNIMGSF